MLNQDPTESDMLEFFKFAKERSQNRLLAFHRKEMAECGLDPEDLPLQSKPSEPETGQSSMDEKEDTSDIEDSNQESSTTDSEDSSNGETYDYDSDAEFTVMKTRKFGPALLKFNRDASKLEESIPQVAQLPWIERVKFVIEMFEKYCFGLHDRPKQIKMGVFSGIDELKSFERAIRIGWRLSPDYSAGMHMMLDYLADDTLQVDIIRLDKATLSILKEIVLNDAWNNNPMGGRLFTSQAKRIILRFGGEQLEENFRCSMFDPFELIIPPFGADRRICEGVDCFEIETNAGDFKRCAKCKKAYYHSKECQLSHWKNGHKASCKA